MKLQCIKVISLAGITCDSEKEMLILTKYLKKYLKKSNTLGKHLKTKLILLVPKHQIQILKKYLNIFKYKCI